MKQSIPIKRLALGLVVLPVFLGSVAPYYSPIPAETGRLTIHFSGLENTTGQVRVVLYKEAGKFLANKGSVKTATAPIAPDRTAVVELSNLPFGTYAAVMHHDENGNNLPDRNWAGLPIEPYGFSNGIRAKWTMPSFEKAKFEFREPDKKLTATVRRWSEQ